MTAHNSPDPRQLNTADVYARADAITDRLLIPVPPTLVRLYRLPWPIAVTADAWDDVVAWPPDAPTHEGRHHHECEEGRLFDLLWMITAAHETATPSHPQRFTVWRISPLLRGRRSWPVRLTLTVLPGEHGDPVATVAHAPHWLRAWWDRHVVSIATVVTVALVANAVMVLLTTDR